MPLRKRLENLSVGHKLLVALLVLLAAVLLVANLAFISAATGFHARASPRRRCTRWANCLPRRN